MLSIYLSIYQSVYQAVYLSIYLSIRLSIYTRTRTCTHIYIRPKEGARLPRLWQGASPGGVHRCAEALLIATRVLSSDRLQHKVIDSMINLRSTVSHRKYGRA